MTEFYVDNLSYALGSVKRTVDESAKSDTFSSAKLLRDSGFETHHLPTRDILFLVRLQSLI